MSIEIIDIIKKSMEEGLLLFSLLFESQAVRITPPLTITESEIEKGCAILLNVLNNFVPKTEPHTS